VAVAEAGGKKEDRKVHPKKMNTERIRGGGQSLVWGRKKRGGNGLEKEEKSPEWGGW